MKFEALLYRGRRMIKAPALLSQLLLIFLLTGCSSSTDRPSQRKVFIARKDGKFVLYRNDTPYIIKGAAGYTHLQKLREIGGNTIRTWDTANLSAILDEAQRQGLAVIAGLPMPVSGYLRHYYKDPVKVQAQYNAFQRVVEKHKDHPALLMWCLGNELIFPFRPSFQPFYKAYNRLLKMIHTTDPDHPVTTTMANVNIRDIINIKLRVRGLDLLSINTFGKLNRMNKDLKRFAWLWNGPFLVTEWGAYGPWESGGTAWGAPVENTSTKKAEQYRLLYEKDMPVNNPRFLGAMVFFWGQKQERTPTWFSLFAENGAASETVGFLQYLWTGAWPAHPAPKVRYMLLDNKGAWDNILLKPGTAHSATLLMEDHQADTLSLHWEIMPEDWYTGPRKAPVPLAVLDTLIVSDNKSLAFRAPLKEGPYRIFVKVYDGHGNFASANTPFYVVE